MRLNSIMAEPISKAKRSKIMAAVRSKGNKDTELRLMAILRRNRISGWRRHPGLPGKPDFVFPAARLAVFVDGCFWHGCRWHCRRPTSNTTFWSGKLAANRQRDRTVNRLLRAKKWLVLRIWEHALTDEERVIGKLRNMLGLRVRMELDTSKAIE